MAKEHKINLVKHSASCSICHHDKRADIELDYIHCIPWATICERYTGLADPQIQRHAIALGLNKKRDRKAFYWSLIEKVPMGKMTVENALEASKQLDRIERVIVDNPTPSNIQVIYSFGKPETQPTIGRIPTGKLSESIPPIREGIKDETPL